MPVWAGVERPRAGREAVGAGGGIRGRRLAYRVAAGVLEWAICDGRYVAMCGWVWRPVGVRVLGQGRGDRGSPRAAGVSDERAMSDKRCR